MIKRRPAVVALGLAALLVAGALIASNMGFKILYDLAGPAGGTSGTNSLGLPFHQQTDLEDAADLLNDIGPTAATVMRFITSSDGLQAYSGLPGDVAFDLSPGEGYLVMVSSDTTYTIVGTHDPFLVLTFVGPGPDSSSGANLYARPYHSVSSTAGQLIDEIDAWAGEKVAVSVQKWISSTDGLIAYSGFTGQTDFPLEPGEAYFVVVNTTTSFVPAHY
jgi:hypothetical protein